MREPNTRDELLEQLTQSNVLTALEDFVSSVQPPHLTTKDWTAFYDLIVTAYNVERKDRLSVSELANHLRSVGFESPGHLAVLYAHGLNILARYHGRNLVGKSRFVP